MKQTVTINLSGIVYNIDDDAYLILNNYLKSIEDQLRSNDSKQEIMQDIEARIAELFTQNLRFGHIEVVNIRMVNEIMSQLGTPEMISNGQPAEEEAEEGSTTQENAAESGENTSQAENPSGAGDATSSLSAKEKRKPFLKRKFYRDIDNQVVAGVCSGLGRLLGVEAIWLRLLFLLIICLQGAGLLIYLLLWLIVPAADTAARRLEMRGIEPSAENIRQEVEEQQLTGGPRKSGNGIGGCLVIILGIMCFPVVFALLAALLGLIAGGAGILAGAIPLAGLFGITQNGVLGVILAAIGVFVFVLTPIITLIIWGIHRHRNKDNMHRSVWITALIIWLIGILCLILGAVNVGNEIRHFTGDTFEQKMDNLEERIRAFFNGNEGCIIVNGDTIQWTSEQIATSAAEGVLQIGEDSHTNTSNKADKKAAKKAAKIATSAAEGVDVQTGKSDKGILIATEDGVLEITEDSVKITH